MSSKGKGKSKRWLQRQAQDVYVKQAKLQGYRSRAAFKLSEINDKHKILRSGMTILDLGAAPGGWSQVAKELVGAKGAVYAIDLLPMEDIPGVEILLGDLQDDSLFERVLADNPDGFDLVISDMAPNLTGITVTDQARSIGLAELALDLVQQRSKPGGDFLIKVFQGQGFTEYLRMLRESFSKVVVCKPKASRPESQEVYLLAKGFKGP